jgi:transposase
MAAYSVDLRQKILSAWQNKEGTQRDLAKRFKVSLSFIREFLRRYRETNELAARPQGGDRRSKLKCEEQELLKTIESSVALLAVLSSHTFGSHI